MEILAQWLDDLDDVVSTCGLVGERIRHLLLAFLFLSAAIILEVAVVLLALRHPPLASATATMLFVFLMYRSATAPRAAVQQPS
jgi:hypothetical protein